MPEPVKNALKLLNSANQLSEEKAFHSLGVLTFSLCVAQQGRLERE